jgi:hypothetical protein
MARFAWYLQGNLAREVCVLTDWKDHVWARPYRCTVLSQEPSVLASRLRYICENGVKENLVGSPLAWPGASSANALASGRRTLRGIWVERAEFTKAKRIRGQEGISEERFTVVETLHLSPLPGFERDWNGYVDFVRTMIESIERDAAERHRSEGTSPLGIDAVMAAHPHYVPEHQRDRSPAPLALASTRLMVKAFRDAYASVVLNYRQAAERLRLGQLDVAFPEGTFPPPRPFRLLPAPRAAIC